MKNIDTINTIRILPSDKYTFPTEKDFREFIENTMVNRGGDYYFPNTMMRCVENTLVLFQYDGMIRAIGTLIEAKKEKVIDEHGIEYAGYYKFDIESLKYLDSPIDREELKAVYPEFKSFNQTKQIIPIEYLNNILGIMKKFKEVNKKLLFEKIVDK